MLFTIIEVYCWCKEVERLSGPFYFYSEENFTTLREYEDIKPAQLKIISSKS